MSINAPNCIITVILALPCLDDVQRFAEEIAPTMVHLHTRNALRCAVWAEDEEWKWIWIATMPEATAAGEYLKSVCNSLCTEILQTWKMLYASTATISTRFVLDTIAYGPLTAKN